MTTYQQPQFASASVPLETFSFSRSSTGRSTNTIDWAIASKLDTEYDADAEDALLSQSRPTGWKGYLMKGGLGIYLLSTNKGWHVYVGLLSFSVAASGCGLLTLNWLVLVAGEYKFPYPATASFIELLGCHILLWWFASFTRLASTPLKNAGLGIAIAPSYSAHLTHPPESKNRPRNCIPRFFHRYTRLSTGIAGEGVFDFDRSLIKHTLLLAVTYTSMILFSNVAYAGTSIPIYTMIRIGVVPLTIIFTTLINGTFPSIAVLVASLSGALGLLVTCIRQDMRTSPVVIVAGILSSGCAGLFPVLLVNTHATLIGSIRTAASNRPSTDLYHTAATTPADTRATYQLLHYLSMISLIILFPVVLLSGELQQISGEFQHLNSWWHWLMMGCASAGTFAVLVGTVLLAKVTSPLTVNFLTVPMYTIMVTVLSKFMLEIYSWVGVALVATSCLWFWRERRMESKRRASE